MTINRLTPLLLLLALSACSTKKVTPPKTDTNSTDTSLIKNNIVKNPALANSTVINAGVPHTGVVNRPIYHAPTSLMTSPPINPMLGRAIIEQSSSTTTGGVGGYFAGNYKLINFIDRMCNEYQFDREYLYQLFSSAENVHQFVEEYRAKSNTNSKPQGKWDRYKGMFIYERNINRGVAFWEKHKNALNKAYQQYGVLPEFIVGILGVETAYGVNFGKRRVIDVLTTKAMLPNRRESFYTTQLEKFLLMTRHSHLDASTLMGSNAGAMGYGQFIASSYLEFAVDFNNDGVIDLWNAEDAIGSVANYFARNGWNRGIRQVAVRAKYRGSRFRKLKTGYKTKYSQYRLRKKYKITPRTRLSYKGPVSLIKLPKFSYDELWFGTHNFRVITTYNHSTFYAMAVFKLGEAVKARRYGR